jgi:hypothetical protein
MLTSFVRHSSPAFFKQVTPLLHIPSNHSTLTIHFNNLSVYSTFLAFKNHITICTSQAAGFSSFLFIFNDYSKWQEKNYDTKMQNTYSL